MGGVLGSFGVRVSGIPDMGPGYPTPPSYMGPGYPTLPDFSSKGGDLFKLVHLRTYSCKQY